MDMMLEKFKTIFDRPEKVKRLREVILDLAVRGKLVEQIKDDSISEFYQHIISAKNKYYEEKYSKKAKILSKKDMKLSFSIPDSWKVICIGDLVDLINGKAFKPAEWSQDGLPIIRIQNLNNINAKFNYCNFEVDEKYYVDDNELLIGWSGTPGTSFGAFVWKRGKGVLNQHIFKAVPYFNFDKEFLKIFINARLDEMIDKSHGAVGLKHITKGRFENMLIPIPPLEEQKRIVEKVDSLMVLCDSLEESLEKKVHYGELAAKSVFNSVGNISSSRELEEKLKFILENFKDISLGDNAVKELKNCILQLAVQGKLVEQDPNDEPAEVLLERIKEEKERLIKEKKIKKEKALAEIREEEKSFELPVGWSWSRLANLGSYKKGPFGSAITKSMFVPKSSNTIKVYEQKNAINKDISLGHYYITEEYFNRKLSGFEVFPGDIIVSCAGTIGEAYIIPNNAERGIINQALMRMKIFRGINIDYFLLYFDYILKKSAKEKSNGSAMKNIPPFAVFKNMLLAVPPLEEQKRIVEKVDSLMALCDELEKKIEEQKEYSNKLMESIIKNSF